MGMGSVWRGLSRNQACVWMTMGQENIWTSRRLTFSVQTDIGHLESERHEDVTFSVLHLDFDLIVLSPFWPRSRTHYWEHDLACCNVCCQHVDVSWVLLFIFRSLLACKVEFFQFCPSYEPLFSFFNHSNLFCQWMLLCGGYSSKFVYFSVNVRPRSIDSLLGKLHSPPGLNIPSQLCRRSILQRLHTAN